MTNGVAGALNVAALLLGGKARFADIFDPARKPSSITAMKEYVAGQAHAVKDLAGYITGGDVDSIDEIAPGEGAIVRRGAHKIAAYRDPRGMLVERSAVCTHVGCLVHWNPLEKCWDCPCHGSQFRPDGSVICGPAVAPLAQAEQPAEADLEPRLQPS
jgi:Rieske Fe-S protein